ncbi:MAG: hypothetical protein QOG77_2946 [Solirubrobacteraceae bacterium]|jgi:uncharacterized OB-fold protein|nr:hypothetical protein [Solirubrobacteraceae bacterium]
MRGSDVLLDLADFAGDGDPSHLLPRPTRQNEPFFAGLAERRLELQRCLACGHARYPVAPACPRCGSTDARWDRLPGTGAVHSWIRYRRSYLPEFEPLMPYVVVCVALDDGPRMFGRLTGTDGDPVIGDRVRMIVERLPSGAHTIAFAAAGET